MRQVHGATVVRVAEPGEGAGLEADAAVTAAAGAVLAVQVADCAPVALVGSNGVVGIAHVGWRGLVAGVLTATLDAMGTLRSEPASSDRASTRSATSSASTTSTAVAAVAGPQVRSRTSDGSPALDLARGDRSTCCDARDVTVVDSPWDALHRVHARVLVAPCAGRQGTPGDGRLDDRAVTDALPQLDRRPARPHRSAPAATPTPSPWSP